MEAALEIDEQDDASADRRRHDRRRRNAVVSEEAAVLRQRLDVLVSDLRLSLKTATTMNANQHVGMQT